MAESMIEVQLPVQNVTKTCDMQHYLKQVQKGQTSGGKKDLVRRFYRNGGKPRGLHDYHNLQWDPNIYRGRAFKDFREKNLPPYRTAINFNDYCCSTPLECRHKSASTIPRRPKKINTFSRFKVGGIVRPTTDDIIDEETSGHKRHKQDEFRKEIEPFVVEQIVPPVYKEMGSQSDECKQEVPMACARVGTGLCVSTQADICSCWSGGDDDPTKGIIESVGTKVLEQSLLESSEEYELQRLRAEISKYVERRRIRQRKQMKIVQDELFRAEVDMKEKVLREREFREEKEAHAAIEAVMFGNVLCHEVMFYAFEQLREQKFLEAEGTVAKSQLGPWLMNQISTDIFIPRHLLNEIITNVETAKSEEYAKDTATSLYENQSDGRDFEGNKSNRNSLFRVLSSEGDRSKSFYRELQITEE